MTNNLFVGKEHIFRDVISLAATWKNLYETSGFEGGNPIEIMEFEKTPAGQKIRQAELALEQYMTNLSFDDVKMLQTVMYLGRDRDYDQSLSSHAIYSDYLQYLGINGWNSKEIEINQMTEKVPLADYLRNGLEILEVSI
jgi:hypothetical protein